MAATDRYTEPPSETQHLGMELESGAGASTSAQLSGNTANYAAIRSNIAQARFFAFTSVFFFMLSAVFFVLLFTGSVGTERPHFDLLREFDYTAVRQMWQHRASVRNYVLAADLFQVIAWMSLIPPIAQLAFVFQRVPNSKAVMFPCFAMAAFISVFDFVFNAGTETVADWEQTWPGFQGAAGNERLVALEISFMVSEGRGLFLFAIDSLLLGLGCFSAANIVYNHRTLPRWWAHLSIVLGILAMVEFLLEVARFAQFQSFAIASAVFVALIYLLFLPIWLITLAFQLKRAPIFM